MEQHLIFDRLIHYDPGHDGVTLPDVWPSSHAWTVVYEFDSIVYLAADEHVERNVLGRHGWLDRVVLGLIDLRRQASFESLLHMTRLIEWGIFYRRL
jgi:hypothetical protein